MSEGEINGKTLLWQSSPASAKYGLPEFCPTCKARLKVNYLYIGIFPYIHTGINMHCVNDEKHKFTFCFPYNPAMAAGYTIFDSKDNTRYYTERVCPFDGAKLVPVRLYGDLVFTDGSRKMQLRCPQCCFSERVIFEGKR
jgi:hypothetical protein